MSVPSAPAAEIVELTADNFDAEVLERSHETPILVDYWAPWCGPCRMLAPILESLATEWRGDFVLAKADTEAHPSLGERHGVRSIPAVKLFAKGRIVGEFVGALSGAEVRRFLQTHLPSAAEPLVRDAAAVLGSDRARARALLREALDTDETHAPAHLALARLAYEDGSRMLVEHHVGRIAPGSPEHDEATRLMRDFDAGTCD